jgi:hypothetical protein
MSNISSNDLIDDVAPGDIIALDEQPAKVVHKEAIRDGSEVKAYLVTFESPDAQTFDREIVAGTRVTRSLEAKWESGQSPTEHKPPTA